MYSATYAQINVNHIDGSFDPGSTEGLVYALPRTMIKLDITVEHREMLAGPLRNYAEEYLGIEDYIRSDRNSYVLKDISISSFSEADPAQFYFVTLGDKSSKESWQTILKLNGQGMLAAIGAGPQATEGGSILLEQKLSPDERQRLFGKNAFLNLFDKVDTIVRTINIDTVTIEDYSFKTVTSAMPLEQKAEEMARKIEKIRDDRYNLITGYQEVNYSEGALRFMNGQLLKLEQEYLRLFTGAVLSRMLTYSIVFLPDAANAGSDIPVFRMSESSGLSTNGSGDQASIRVIPSGNTAGLASGAMTANGLYYRLPEKARLELRLNGKVIASAYTSISQLGKVAVLPSSAYNVEFDEETGGLKSVHFDGQ